MGTFEDTVAKAKEVLDTAGQKTSNIINIQKLRVNLATANSQLSKLYEALGRLCFDTDTNDGPAIAELKGKIEAKIVDIRDIEVKIATAKGDKVCETCYAKNVSDADYCNKCGQKFECEPEADEESEAE